MNEMTPEDQIRALEAKCALYAASLKKADARVEKLEGALREIAESSFGKEKWIARAVLLDTGDGT